MANGGSSTSFIFPQLLHSSLCHYSSGSAYERRNLEGTSIIRRDSPFPSFLLQLPSVAAYSQQWEAIHFLHLGFIPQLLGQDDMDKGHFSFSFTNYSSQVNLRPDTWKWLSTQSSSILSFFPNDSLSSSTRDRNIGKLQDTHNDSLVLQKVWISPITLNFTFPIIFC